MFTVDTEASKLIIGDIIIGIVSPINKDHKTGCIALYIDEINPNIMVESLRKSKLSSNITINKYGKHICCNKKTKLRVVRI